MVLDGKPTPSGGVWEGWGGFGCGQSVELSPKNNDFDILKGYKKTRKRKICLQFYKNGTTTKKPICGLMPFTRGKCIFEMWTC